MKPLQVFRFLALSLALLFSLSMVSLGTGCQAPSTRVGQVKTLKAVGESRDATMKIAANLLANGQITVDQWTKIAKFHDERLQPAYNLAVGAVRADLDSVASPDLLLLLTQFVSLVAPYSKQPIPMP